MFENPNLVVSAHRLQLYLNFTGYIWCPDDSNSAIDINVRRHHVLQHDRLPVARIACKLARQYCPLAFLQLTFDEGSGRDCKWSPVACEGGACADTRRDVVQELARCVSQHERFCHFPKRKFRRQLTIEQQHTARPCKRAFHLDKNSKRNINGRQKTTRRNGRARSAYDKLVADHVNVRGFPRRT